MPLPPRLFPGDEELGKRDDDHRPGRSRPFGMNWQQRQSSWGPHRRTMRRMALAIVALLALYYFFRNMPTDLRNPRPRPHYDHSTGRNPLVQNPSLPPQVDQGSRAGNRDEKHKEQPQHDFNGPIKFYELAGSLQTGSRRKGSDTNNRNVLFAAASLKSASLLLPFACEMSSKDLNKVHFAFMGRDTIPMDTLRSVNSITKDCKVTYHDARPDFSLESSDLRMAVSSSAAFNHINTYIGPQATFIDLSGEEDAFLLKGVRDRAESLGRTIIELPGDAEQNLMWTTLLDSASLSAWDKASIDILVHAPLSSSGSLIRLLESLKDADYFSSAPPKLTIELPHEIDEATRRYLESFKWPPNPSHNTGNQLTLHHRIPQHGLTVEESAIRFLEAFWPADPESSHVLILSPQVELSPLFFHYLKYTLLEYKYSAANRETHDNLIGISLEVPSTHINASAEFAPPSSGGANGADATQFLWQAPNSNAELYFGTKWVELHDFVTHMLVPGLNIPEKLVSKTYPSWLEHILSLSRARGYWTLYPNFQDADAIATIHSELYQLPEEYSHDSETEPPEINDVLTADPASAHKHSEAPLISKSLLIALPNNGDLPTTKDLPLLSWDGESLEVADLERKTTAYVESFRRDVGGCDATAVETERVGLTTADLFCLVDNQA